MQIFNLKYLNSSQEVPKILYKPISITDDNIYFEKLIIGMEDTWSEGIWEYDKKNHTINRLDKGHHAENVQLYDFDTPVNFLSRDVEGSKEQLYFATITEIDEEDYIEFFEIDLEKRKQRSILGFTFDKDSFFYKKMEVLAPGYILFRLTYDMELVDSDFFDSMYLLDVKEKKYYEIMDEAFNINSGNRFLIGENFDEQYLLIEEYYLDEEEQFEILTSEDVELAFDLPGEIEQEQLHVNSIKIIKLSDFIDQIKAGEETLDFEILDKVDQDGVIRIIGETRGALYYKKEQYDFILRQKNDFMSRRKLGRTEIYKIDKFDLEVSYVKDIDKASKIRHGEIFIYEIIEDEENAQIFDLDTGELIYNYKFRYNGQVKQEVVGFKDDEYLIVKYTSLSDDNIFKYEVMDTLKNKTIIIGDDILVLDGYIFVI